MNKTVLKMPNDGKKICTTNAQEIKIVLLSGEYRRRGETSNRNSHGFHEREAQETSDF